MPGVSPMASVASSSSPVSAGSSTGSSVGYSAGSGSAVSDGGGGVGVGAGGGPLLTVIVMVSPGKASPRGDVPVATPAG